MTRAHDAPLGHRQLSIPETLLEDLKTYIDNGDDEGARACAKQLRTWGITNDDIAVHVNGWRVQNALTADSSVFDDTALEVLDMLWYQRSKML